jgi:hypothetical protein
MAHIADDRLSPPGRARLWMRPAPSHEHVDREARQFARQIAEPVELAVGAAILHLEMAGRRRRQSQQRSIFLLAGDDSWRSQLISLLGKLLDRSSVTAV